MNPFYAGIGSRETPQPILTMMAAIARKKRLDGCILRSGGADGADKAFEAGSEGRKEIFVIYYPSFNSPDYYGPPTKAAVELAERHHPAWIKCGPKARLLHGRNSHILLGLDLKTPVQLVICWTEGAKGGGGTGQGIRIAKAHGIDVHDLADPEIHRIYTDWLAAS